MLDIIKITDLHQPELLPYTWKTENQLLHYNEPDPVGLFIAESPRVVERALDAGYEPISAVLEEKHIQGEARPVLDRLSRDYSGLPVYTSSLEVLRELTGVAMSRGMLCLMHRKPLRSVEEVIRGSRRIAVIDDVENPTNVGAIFRSAAALNMDAVLLTPTCSNPLYRRAIRVSMGTVFQVPWTFIGLDGWPHPGMDQLKQNGFKAAAFALKENSVSIDDPQLMGEAKLAILMGNEGEGLLPETIEACDYTVKIPMSHGVDSLNVAAASAVAFWQLGR